jgi:threonine synthase
LFERKLISTISGECYDFSKIEEYTDAGESLEVKLPNISDVFIKNKEKTLYERFRGFIPFSSIDMNDSLGEGSTPLLKAGTALQEYCRLPSLWLKDETRNPTGSFKDRGSLFCLWMAREMNEDSLFTISTGNMGHSLAAYAARAGKRAVIFVPEYAPESKIKPMIALGAEVYQVRAPDYSVMKTAVLNTASEAGIRVTSGNGAIRVEGYKFTAFELFEQLACSVPDYIAVPTSACGHIRGIFKGYRELMETGIIRSLPKMIVVQASNNAPLVKAILMKEERVTPFPVLPTIAEAITSTNPPGGNEIVRKAIAFDWLAESESEEEIIASQRLLARQGFFVEASSATVLGAVKKLVEHGKIPTNAKVVLVLTGTGLKETNVSHFPLNSRKSIRVEEIRSAFMR